MQTGASVAARGKVWIAHLAGLMLLAGCSTGNAPGPGILDNLLGPPPPTPAPTFSQQEPDKSGCGTAAQCQGVLKTMIDSPDRGWIGKRQSPAVYANGTRLFAYRALRKQLTCRELTLAVEEMGAATKSLDGPVPGMTPDQSSRTRALSAQVEGELAKERAGRCRS